jgi:hypothetical protein
MMTLGQDGWGIPDAARVGMDGLQKLLDAVRDSGLAAGHFRGLVHVAVGRKVSDADGNPVSAGVTWRDLAERLRVARFDVSLGLEVGADADVIAPRDRQRFWYAAISLTQPDGAEAVRQAEALAAHLKRLGFVVGPAPAGLPPAAPPPPPRAVEPAKKPKKK